MKTVMSEGPTAIAASVLGTIAPTVSPIADAAKDSTVTILQNFPNLEVEKLQNQPSERVKLRVKLNALLNTRSLEDENHKGEIFRDKLNKEPIDQDYFFISEYLNIFH